MEKQCILNEIYLLEKGVRDCFSETVMEPEDIDFIIGQASSHNYYVYTREFEDEYDKKKFYIVYVCKYNYQKVMLHKIYTDKGIDRITKAYIEGSILGYSGEAMEEYLMKIIVNSSIAASVNKKEDDITAPV